MEQRHRSDTYVENDSNVWMEIGWLKFQIKTKKTKKKLREKRKNHPNIICFDKIKCRSTRMVSIITMYTLRYSNIFANNVERWLEHNFSLLNTVQPTKKRREEESLYLYNSIQFNRIETQTFQHINTVVELLMSITVLPFDLVFGISHPHFYSI